MNKKNIINKIYKKMIALIKKIETKNLTIEAIKQDDELGLLYLVIRITGKCTPPIKKTPYDLLMENGSRLSEMLSEADFNSLITCLLENQKRLIELKYMKKYSLINHQFSPEGPMITYQNKLTKKQETLSAKNIFYNTTLIENFDSKDAACIGSIVGAYEAETEYKLRHKVNQDSIVKFDIVSVVKNIHPI